MEHRAISSDYLSMLTMFTRGFTLGRTENMAIYSQTVKQYKIPPDSKN